MGWMLYVYSLCKEHKVNLNSRGADGTLWIPFQVLGGMSLCFFLASAVLLPEVLHSRACNPSNSLQPDECLSDPPRSNTVTPDLATSCWSADFQHPQSYCMCTCGPQPACTPRRMFPTCPLTWLVLTSRTSSASSATASPPSTVRSESQPSGFPPPRICLPGCSSLG